MEERTELISGRTKIIIIREASGVDKVKEAIRSIMGPGYVETEESND